MDRQTKDGSMGERKWKHQLIIDNKWMDRKQINDGQMGEWMDGWMEGIKEIWIQIDDR